MAAAVGLVPIGALGSSSAAGTVSSGTTTRPIASDQPQVAYPPLGLVELSGLTASVLHPGVVWVVEDSGEPIVHAYDATGAQVGSVLFAASDVFAGDNRDTESLAMGPGPTLWSADIGDNSAIRQTVLVHTTPEPATLGDSTVTAASYRFTYPDGPRDAESLLVDPVDGRAYIGTKGVLGGGGWYAAPAHIAPGETHELTRVQDLPGLLTGGEFSPDGTMVALRTLGITGSGEARLYAVVRNPSGGPVTLAELRAVTLPDEQQGEALTFTRDGTALLVGSEGTDEPIWSVPLPPDLVAATTAAQTSGSPLAADTAPEAGSAPGTGSSEADGEACGLADIGSCLTSPAGALVLLMGVLAALLSALAVLRRRVGRRP